MSRRICDDGAAEVFLVIHMDDILVATRDTAAFEGFVVGLRGKFAIKDLVKLYLECRFTCSREEGTIKFDQHIYVKTVAER